MGSRLGLASITVNSEMNSLVFLGGVRDGTQYNTHD